MNSSLSFGQAALTLIFLPRATPCSSLQLMIFVEDELLGPLPNKQNLQVLDLDYQMGLFSSPTLYFKKKNERCYIKLAFLQFLVHVLSIIINVHVHKKIILLCLLCGTLHTLLKTGYVYPSICQIFNFDCLFKQYVTEWAIPQ